MLFELRYDDGSGRIPQVRPLHCGPDSDPKNRTARNTGRHLTARDYPQERGMWAATRRR